MQPDISAENKTLSRVPLYIAGFGASAMGIVALSTVTLDGTFAPLIVAYMATGTSLSYAARTNAVSRSFATGVATGIAALTLAAGIISPQVRNQLFPPEMLTSTDLLLAGLLAWLMVIYSFNLKTDRTVLFQCVPSLSLIGLIATFESSAEVLTHFSIFLACACFVLVQQNFFTDREPAIGSTGSVRLHMGLTASVTLTALAMGIIFGHLLYPILSKSFASRMAAYGAPPIMEYLIAEEFIPVGTGPAPVSEREIMRVRCDEALLWRGRAFSTYTEKGWASPPVPGATVEIRATGDRSPRTDPDFDPRTASYTFNIPEYPWLEGRRAVKRAEQTIEVSRGWLRTVFAASEPETVIFRSPQPLIKSPDRLERSTPYGRTEYKVTSLVSIATPRQLRQTSEDYPSFIRARYLDTPESCQEVERLTRRVITGQINAFGKALAIQRFLEANFKYDLNAPAAPEDEDAVVHFLFKSRRGYCDVFASAMVIMCRQAGIPARWATGFTSGKYNKTEGVYHVRARDRHAWAELFFPEYGWIAFDPAPMGDDEGLVARLRESWTDTKAILSSYGSSMLIAALILLLLGYLIKTELLDGASEKRRDRKKRPAAPATRASRNYRQMCEILSREGYVRYPSATPREFAADLDHLFPLELEHLSAAVNSLTNDFVESRYSPRELPQERTTAMTVTLQALKRYIKAARRQKLLPKQSR